MKRIVEKRRVILINATWGYGRDSTQLYFYERKHRENDHKGSHLHNSDYWAGVEDIRDATDLTERSDQDAMCLFHAIKEYLKDGESIELVDLELIMKIKPVSFNPDEEREHLRAKALQKLTEDEIHALGVENLAVYDKLKNHNA